MSEGFGLLTLNPGAGASLEIHLCAFKALVSALLTLKYFPPDHLLRAGSCWPRPGYARSHQPGPEWGAGGGGGGGRNQGRRWLSLGNSSSINTSRSSTGGVRCAFSGTFEHESSESLSFRCNHLGTSLPGHRRQHHLVLTQALVFVSHLKHMLVWD